MKKASILISGAGQLGMRYLQGMARSRLPLDIHVQDINGEALKRARQGWEEAVAPDALHEVSFHESFELLPSRLDIAIVATTADVRPRMVAEVAGRFEVKFWILEKLLAQSEQGLDEILSDIDGCEGAWVNTARRMMPWHQQIRSQLDTSRPLTLTVDGGEWGLACNAIHFLDMFSWWTGESLESVNTDRLDHQWHESKRSNFWEVFGTLEAGFSRGGAVHLTASRNGPYPSITVAEVGYTWQINEADGLAQRSDGVEIKGGITHQSERSGAMVESILESGSCGLPTVVESASLHRVFLRSMLAHWQGAGNPGATYVPAT